MGEGSIDGRGGAKLLGQEVTWWDLAHEAKITDKRQNVPRLISVERSNGFILYKIKPASLRLLSFSTVPITGTRCKLPKSRLPTF
jgi:hypothetical protein